MNSRRFARIAAIEYILPDGTLTNEDLVKEYPSWSVDKIFSKTGIAQRHIAASGETSADLAERAGRALLASGAISASDIDFLILCTQSPDYFLPATACVLQARLGLPKSCGAFDFNQGCSGYIYGLGIAKGLIESGQAQNVLLLTAETYSKFIHPGDKSVRTLFGDAAAATLVSAEEANKEYLSSFVYGTDGAGAEHLIVPGGGMRMPRTPEMEIEYADESENRRSRMNLYMNGPAIFEFSMQSVPALVNEVLEKGGLSLDQIDVFALHQANRFMLDSLQRRICAPSEKFLRAFESCGNTVSSTIPIALKEAHKAGKLQRGQKLLLIGFGVGLSWAGCLACW